MASGSKTNELPREDSSWVWLLRGMVLGALVIGSANALSFFVRSKGWGGLLGKIDPYDEAIGFPLAIWIESGGYGTHGLKTGPFLLMIASALLVGTIAGGLAIANRGTLNAILTRMSSSSSSQVRLQFSLRGLMITTLVSAVTAAVVKSFAVRVELLAAIYLLGPVTLILLAFAPPKLSWQQRVAILTPMTFAMIAAAITLGIALGIEFDKVLLGIFICWVPQTAIAAMLLAAWLMHREYKTLPHNVARRGAA